MARCRRCVPTRPSSARWLDDVPSIFNWGFFLTTNEHQSTRMAELRGNRRGGSKLTSSVIRVNWCSFVVRTAWPGHVHSRISVFSDIKSGHDSFMLKFGTFEVQVKPYAQSCDPQIVYHPPPTFVVGNPVNYLRINDDRAVGNKTSSVNVRSYC
jgi:hypothetical protein